MADLRLFFTLLTRHGHGSPHLARCIFFGLSVIHAQKTKRWVPGIHIYAQALENVKPAFEIRKYRKGGSTQFYPVPCHPHRQRSLALRWIFAASKDDRKSKRKVQPWPMTSMRNAVKHKGKPTLYAFVMTLYACFQREGKVFQKRNEIHRLAEANRMALTRL